MRIKSVLILSCATLALASCSGMKRQLGLERNAPDEFAVVKRAPLEMPPDYTLRPPRPGAPRPQEQATDRQAREAIFGGENDSRGGPTTGEDALLREAGADNSSPDIRSTIDRETAAMAPASQPAVTKLFNIGRPAKPAASVVDAPKEVERIQKNMDNGQPVTQGRTPAVDR